ncbi:hypothetical protein BDN72DRAFT_842191 [Pluteus cervinus]|uniref:Uncharacterized protein n=1 Tax=Pluteus cervinus TaxID=181527 RepID=A0ACD3AR85_9AGAR|nr:hypothetical protein BDN72DRAFT_842191 [Pluteus cervinus]
MPASPLHRPTNSLSGNLHPPSPGPTPKQQRRMTSPAHSLTLPEGHAYQQQQGRPPSPLRNGFIPDTSTGIHAHDDHDSDDEDNDPQGWQRSPSPTSSVSQFAANFAKSVGSFVGGITSPRSDAASPLMPTDAELEAEALRERDRSRREAERILSYEAHERGRLEERVLSMMETTRALPPPPSRSYSMPNPPSPSGSSQKEGSTGWWAAAKNRLTQSKDKEPLTPAQQVIHDAKAREKETKKLTKGKEKERDGRISPATSLAGGSGAGAWPSSAQGKYSDPAYMNLNIPQRAVTPITRKPVPPSPTSPTPSRPSSSNMAPNLTPSPLRSLDMSTSPSREAPPLYAQFNAQGTLDVHGSLLTILKRFEKLEKWTVGHVRALEERMSDVEKWLVDKEKEKDDGSPHDPHSSRGQGGPAGHEMLEMREELAELQGRVSELGREMAKMATAPSNLSSGPSRQSAQVSVAPQTSSSIVIHGNAQATAVASETTTTTNTTSYHTRLVSSTAMESTSAPLTSSRMSTGTRLPYPTGDYAIPHETGILQGTFSPTNSPPSSLSSATRSRPISGLPVTSAFGDLDRVPSISSLTSPTMSSSDLPRATPTPPPVTASPRSMLAASHTPSAAARTPTSPQNLPTPKGNSARQTSVSPTPRKRYTVALGGPLVPPPDNEPPAEIRRAGTPFGRDDQVKNTSTAYFSSNNGHGHHDDDDDDGGVFQDETIGKSSAARWSGGLAHANANGNGNGTGDYKPHDSNPRIRAQSVYGFSSLQSQQQQQQQQQLAPSVAPLRVRSRSTDRSGTNGNGNGPGHGHSHSIAFGSTGSIGAGLGGGIASGLGGSTTVPSTPTSTQGRFVDPLLLRRQEKETGGTVTKLAMPRPMGKVPIGQLVAFFDGEKK